MKTKHCNEFSLNKLKISQVKNCQKFDPEQRGVGFKLGFFWPSGGHSVVELGARAPVFFGVGLVIANKIPTFQECSSGW